MKARVISDTKQRTVNFEIAGKAYPVALTLNCVESIQDRYGSMDEAIEKLSNIKEFKFILKVLLDEAVEIFNETANEEDKLEKLSESYIGRKIDMNNLGYYNRVLADIFGVSLPDGEETDTEAQAELESAVNEAVPDMPDSPNPKAE